MTCIVGCEHDDVVYIGGDSAGVSGYDISTRVDEKIFIREEFIMGFSGSFRMGQLLRYALTIPEQSQRLDDMAYLVTDFMDAVRACYRDRGFLGKTDEVEESSGAFMLGYRGKLYTIEEDFQVGRVSDDYFAIGCGSDIALGAMYAQKNTKDPVARITCALEAAAKFSAGVRGPFKILQLKNGDCGE